MGRRRISVTDVRNMFARTVREGAGWDTLIEGQGSEPAWKVCERDPVTGGLSRVEYIGLTRREAWQFLNGAATALASTRH